LQARPSDAEAEGVVPDFIVSALARLSDEHREALTAYAAKAAWPAGFAIYQRGSPADGVFVVLSGRIVLRSRVRAGRGFVPWIATRGETFGSEGLHPGSQYVTDARAEEESETLFLSSTRFRAFVREQPQHAIGLFSQLMAERAGLLDKLRELTTLSVEQRIIATLSRLSHTDIFVRSDGKIELCPQRYRLLCELVGATRESVSLVLSRLGADGLVERQGTTLVVTSLAQMIERAGFPAGDVEIPLSGLEQQTEQAIH
jgi:CRP-like cAMP-binding protein